MKKLRELQKAEAIKRMEGLGIMSQAIKEFAEEGKVYRSENKGLLYWLDEEEQKIVKSFENKYNGIVYHVIKTPTTIGLMYSLLYVSKDIEEWPMDMADIADERVFVYVVNVDTPDYSEFGSIGIRPMIGGIERIW